MRTRSTVIVGKTLRALMRLRGGGSALPGLIAERIDPHFMQRTLAQLPLGVVLISGTNGKTTTTKMVVELLESQGLSVFTNRTGSNFTRGVTAALLAEVDSNGKLRADIAVLELDEAHAVHFARAVPPAYSLFLNVLRDQLDRFGEIDHTANLLKQIAEATTKGIVVNRDDPRLGSEAFMQNVAASKRTYGVARDLLEQFPSDEAIHGHGKTADSSSAHPKHDDTQLDSFQGNHARISYGSSVYDIELKLKGIYNLQNAVGAVALIRMVMGTKLDESAMLRALSNVLPAFGRGETIMLEGQPIELVLVKNPSGFCLSLQSFESQNAATMIAINDNYADGRDMSWLWDVDFESLEAGGVHSVSGVRAYDMALRLQYDNVAIISVEPRLSVALQKFLEANSERPKRIFCTYTAMLAIRRELSKITKVEVVS